MSVALKWTGAGTKLFVGRDSFGHVVMTGSWPDDDPEWQEWKALKSSDLLLLSLASCSAYDVVLILERQRQDVTGLYVNVEGKNAEDPPYQFTDIHLHYTLEGNNLDARKVERAIKLSDEKYCSVSATVRGVANLTNSFEIR
ncbi:MAG: OsmC family protein [Chloroflexi bacterium]|nr:OsmC family protein [Chloroflexota bacterium]